MKSDREREIERKRKRERGYVGRARRDGKNPFSNQFFAYVIGAIRHSLVTPTKAMTFDRSNRSQNS